MPSRSLNLILALMMAVCMAAIACAIWFTATALSDTEFAARQQLTDIYHSELTGISLHIDIFWDQKKMALDSAAGKSPAATFAAIVQDGSCDSALVFDIAGNLLYPQLETSDAAGQEYDILLALEHMATDDPLFEETASRLALLLTDYENALMPSARRVFLMTRLQQLLPKLEWPTLNAERMAIEYAPLLMREQPMSGLSSPAPGVMAYHPEESQVVMLFEPNRLRDKLTSIVESGADLPGVRIDLVDSASSDDGAYISKPIGAAMPGWRLDLRLNGADPFALEAKRRQQAYLLSGGSLVICVICLFVIAAGYVSRQVRLARLKNDLISTVSHELRTPISSIRVLLDTLREGSVTGQKESREYLDMMSREVGRLGRLVENFLTFSRMERNARRREFSDVAMEDVLRDAIDSAKERFDAPGCELRLECPERLPRVFGNRDSLMTVLQNLIDNACKYTGDSKKVVIRAKSESGQVVIEVEDNGIGISPSDAEKIFDRFYQADRTLTRTASGCGLGLAIVKHLVEEHGGSVRVRSELGKGSAFIVNLPARAQ